MSWTKIFKIREFGVLVALISLTIFLSLKSDDFFNFGNIMITVRMASELGIIACGVLLLMIAGEFDLSVGSIFALSPMISAICYTNFHLPIVVATLIGLSVAVLLGYCNGVVTVKTGIPSFITTLGTMMIFRSVVLVISNAFPVKITADATISKVIGGYLPPFSDDMMYDIPMAVVWVVVIMIIAYYVLEFTPLGNRIIASGGNEKAAIASGINTKKVKVITFMIVAFLAAFAGHIQAFRLGSVAPLNGKGMELAVIAACVIGGASLFGGVGTVFGTALGVLMTGLIKNGIVLLGVDVNWQEGFLGIVLIIAVIVNIGISNGSFSVMFNKFTSLNKRET
jgi:simple sugar transport system permease protein